MGIYSRIFVAVDCNIILGVNRVDLDRNLEEFLRYQDKYNTNSKKGAILIIMDYCIKPNNPKFKE